MSSTTTLTMTVASPPPSPPRSSTEGTLLTTTADTTTTTTTTPPSSKRDALASPGIIPRRDSLPASPPCCPSCGTDLAATPHGQSRPAPADAHGQISALQAQVRLLNDKASAAVDRWADYEDELATLRAELAAAKEAAAQQPDGSRRSSATGYRPASLLAPTPTTPSSSSLLPSPQQTTATPRTSTSSSFFPAGAASRLSALLSPRKSTPPADTNNRQQQPSFSLLSTSPSHGSSLSPSSPAGSRSPQRQISGSSARALSPAALSPTPSTDELMEALSREQALRRAAETQLNDTSREVEELSVSLFEEANEMVATERRARARLEERVGHLERRDAERRRRLERLESAVARIERVRAILAEDKDDNKNEKNDNKKNSSTISGNIGSSSSSSGGSSSTRWSGGSGGGGGAKGEAQIATKKTAGTSRDSGGSEKWAGGIAGRLLGRA